MRQAARFARPSTSGLTLSKHPFGTALVPRVVPNITLPSHVRLFWELDAFRYYRNSEIPKIPKVPARAEQSLRSP